MTTSQSSRQPYLSTPTRPFSPANPTTRTANRSPGQRQTTGSATQTITNTSADPSRSASPDPLVLRLRGAVSSDTVQENDGGDANGAQRRRPHIQWAEDVIDNEGLGRKRSKVCCIYHKPRAVGESSDESSDSSDSSDSDSDSSGSGGRGRFSDGARPTPNSTKGPPEIKNDGHDSDGCDEHDHDHGQAKGKRRRRPSPNAYEKMPKYDVKPLTQQPGTSG